MQRGLYIKAGVNLGYHFTGGETEAPQKQSDVSKVTCKFMAKQSLESSYFSFFVVLSSAGDFKALVSIGTCTVETPWELKNADVWVPPLRVLI